MFVVRHYRSGICCVAVSEWCLWCGGIELWLQCHGNGVLSMAYRHWGCVCIVQVSSKEEDQEKEAGREEFNESMLDYDRVFTLARQILGEIVDHETIHDMYLKLDGILAPHESVRRFLSFSGLHLVSARYPLIFFNLIRTALRTDQLLHAWMFLPFCHISSGLVWDAIHGRICACVQDCIH